MARKVNYLNNKDMLAEIHKSKLTYCWVLDDSYTNYDVILENIEEINDQIISEAKENQAKRIKDKLVARIKAEKDKKVKTADITVLPSSIEINELVFRVMTYEHIPLEPGRKKTPKTVADHHSKVNFPPFKHYAYIDNKLTEVLRSHWEGDLDD